MNNKIHEILVDNNEKISGRLILKSLKEKKIIQIKNKLNYRKEILHPIHIFKPGIILNSSGSSGKAKYCYHPIEHLNQSANVSGAWLKEQGFEPNNLIVFNTLPLNHISGLMPLWRSKIWECEYQNIEPQLLKNTKSLLEKTLQIKKNTKKVFITSLVPTQLYRLLLDNNGIDWLNLFELIWVGGASISKKILQKCVLQKINLSPCYGATETTAMVTSLKPQEFLNGNFSAGEILKDINLRTKENHLIEIKTSRIGYEISKKSEINDFRNKNGWWESGDIGEIFKYKNKDYLKIYGRIDNTINSGGEIIFLDLIKEKIEDFISRENIPLDNFRFEKLDDEIWGAQYRILINFKNNIEDKNIPKYMKKLVNLSNNFQKFEKPLEWIIENKNNSFHARDQLNWKSMM
tara:strand:+ start:768 stop:1982 length:1215 start_codon:yes stop_codon:yes gene_type:complete